MVDNREDDLFQHTSMTFGEHLEELRSALFKAVIALVVGFAIGLFFAGPIVRAIESPLKLSLEKFYQEKEFAKVSAQLPPELADNEEIRKSLTELIFVDGLMPEERFISPTDLLAALRQRYPGQFDDIELPPASGDEAPESAASATEQKKATPSAVEQPAPQSKGNQTSESAGEAERPGEAAAAGSFSKQAMIRLYIWRPLSEDERLRLDALSVQEPFVIYIKAGFLAGAVISSPAVFYFLWQFVAAGLYPHEKRYIHIFLPFSLGLFFTGAALAFFFVFPPVLQFFFGIAQSLGTEVRPRLSEWLSFVLLLPLGFGISFQLPLVMLFLERINLFTVEVYLAKWRIAVLVIAVISMVLSPGGDPYSMLMMLVPLIGLYFAGVALCRWLPSRRGPAVAKK